MKLDALNKEKASLQGQVAGLTAERDELQNLIRESPVQQRKMLEQIEAIDVEIAAKQAALETLPDGLASEEERQAVRAVRQDVILDLKNERERLRQLIVGENA